MINYKKVLYHIKLLVFEVVYNTQNYVLIFWSHVSNLCLFHTITFNLNKDYKKITSMKCKNKKINSSFYLLIFN